MTLRQVAEKVNYAKEVHNSVKLSELIQRELDDKTRAGEIGNYLLTNEDRFFNSLVVAVYDGDPEWHEFHNVKPTSSDINVDDIDYSSRYSVGYLSLSGSEKLFALDGQHRLAGIRSALAQDESIGEDEVSVIVVAHHTSAPGQKRTRKLFTTLNKTAKPVSKSEIIALDEADAMAITARRLVEGDPRFSDKLVHIKRKQPNLPQTDREHLITLINLYDILEILFCKSKKGTKAAELKRFRPDDDELDTYASFAGNFFTLLGKIAPELRRCLDSATPAVEIEKQRHAEGGHVLFRPVGILIYAEIVATLMRSASMDLADAVAELRTLPTELSKPPYAGVLWDETTGTMVVKNRALTRELLLHYLGHLKDPARVRKMEARYALLLDDDDAKPPVRTGMKTSRLVRRTRSK
jgi:DNA sulfur modification protein DndB